MKLLFGDLGQTDTKVKGGHKKSGKQGLIGLGFTFVLNQARMSREKFASPGKITGGAKPGKGQLQVKMPTASKNAWDLVEGELGPKGLGRVLHKIGERSASFPGLKKRLGITKKSLMGHRPGVEGLATPGKTGSGKVAMGLGKKEGVVSAKKSKGKKTDLQSATGKLADQTGKAVATESKATKGRTKSTPKQVAPSVEGARAASSATRVEGSVKLVHGWERLMKKETSTAVNTKKEEVVAIKKGFAKGWPDPALLRDKTGKMPQNSAQETLPSKAGESGVAGARRSPFLHIGGTLLPPTTKPTRLNGGQQDRFKSGTSENQNLLSPSKTGFKPDGVPVRQQRVGAKQKISVKGTNRSPKGSIKSTGLSEKKQARPKTTRTEKKIVTQSKNTNAPSQAFKATHVTPGQAEPALNVVGERPLGNAPIGLPDELLSAQPRSVPTVNEPVAATATEASSRTEPATPSKPPPPQPMFRQLEDGMRQAYILRPRAVTVKIIPEDLGEIRIKVSLENEKVKASIEVSNSKVAAIIRDHRGELEERLRDQGVDLERVDVSEKQEKESDLSNGGQNRSSSREETQQGSRRHGKNAPDGKSKEGQDPGIEEETEQPENQAVSEGQPISFMV